MKNLEIFLPLSKIDVANRIVYGVFACEEPDNSGEIMDYASSKPEFEKWSNLQKASSDGKSLGNVRVMHTKVAAGKVISIDFDDLAKRITGAVKVVDEAEWAKVEAGVYTGFSVGGKYGSLQKDAGNPKLKRYTAIPSEISLVDKPCMKSATFEVLKADGASELRKFQTGFDDIEQGFRAKDGTFFLQKIAAEKYNEKLEKIAAAAESETTEEQHPALKKLDELNKTVDDLEPEGKKDKKDGESDQEEGPKEETPVGLAKADTLQKGMFNVARLAQIIDDLSWLAECIICDARMEGDSAPIQLKAKITALGADLKKLVEHEIKELAAKTEKFDGLPEGDIARLEKFNLPDGLKKVRVEVNAEVQKVIEERDGLKKVVSSLEKGLDDLNKRFATLERQPAPPKGVIRAVERGHELSKDLNGKTEARDRSGDTLKMPSGLSPRDQRDWIANNRPKQH